MSHNNSMTLSPQLEDITTSERSTDIRPEEQTAFCVKWTPSIDGIFKFISEYRKIINCPLGGSRECRYHYCDRTIAKVLSVGASDNRSALPQRICLSNFKTGPPITSYGVIYRYLPPDKEPEYLLIRRNESVSYLDIIRGNYRESQLYFMIQDLPQFERERLLSYNFDVLWHDIHLKPAEGDAYEYGKEIFNKLSTKLPRLFEKIPSLDPNGKYLWLFPKGRPEWRDSQQHHDTAENGNESEKKSRGLVPESPIECAIREFREETNGIDLLTPDNSLLFAEPVIERYLGSNSKNYQTQYFIYQTTNKPEIKPFETIQTPIRHVSVGEADEIKWVPVSQIIQYLRPARLELINYIETHLPKVNPAEVAAIWKCPAEINEFNIEMSY